MVHTQFFFMEKLVKVVKPLICVYEVMGLNPGPDVWFTTAFF